MVQGVALPNAGSTFRGYVANTPAGQRVPTPKHPVIATRVNSSVAFATVGASLSEISLQVFSNVLDHGMDPATALQAPRYLLPYTTPSQPAPQLAQAYLNGSFSSDVLTQVAALGQPTAPIAYAEFLGEQGITAVLVATRAHAIGSMLGSSNPYSNGAADVT